MVRCVSKLGHYIWMTSGSKVVYSAIKLRVPIILIKANQMYQANLYTKPHTMHAHAVTAGDTSHHIMHSMDGSCSELAARAAHQLCQC